MFQTSVRGINNNYVCIIFVQILISVYSSTYEHLLLITNVKCKAYVVDNVDINIFYPNKKVCLL